jgi:hypothetical protein
MNFPEVKRKQCRDGQHFTYVDREECECGALPRICRHDKASRNCDSCRLDRYTNPEPREPS